MNNPGPRDPARDALQLEALGANAFVITLIGFVAFVAASILAD